MKNDSKFTVRLFLLVMIVTIGVCPSMGQKKDPVELIGTWTGGVVDITIRTKESRKKFNFTKGEGAITFTINKDFSVDGRIGKTEFKGAKLKKNWGNPEKTGVAYIVVCGPVGKIFDLDPLEKKKVELWLGPLKEGMESSMRYTERGAYFPMAGVVFKKE